MQHSENIMVISLFVLLTILTLLLNIVRPKSGIKGWYFGDGRVLDKSKMLQYVILLLVTAVGGMAYGYGISKNISLTLQFTGGCLIMVAVAGVNLVLYRRKGK